MRLASLPLETTATEPQPQVFKKPITPSSPFSEPEIISVRSEYTVVFPPLFQITACRLLKNTAQSKTPPGLLPDDMRPLLSALRRKSRGELPRERCCGQSRSPAPAGRSEEHTSELQSR